MNEVEVGERVEEEGRGDGDEVKTETRGLLLPQQFLVEYFITVVVGPR